LQSLTWPTLIVVEKRETNMPLFRKEKRTTNVSKAQIDDARELTTFALVAMKEEDVDMAVQRIREALKILGR
jgi:hypothetical protein